MKTKFLALAFSLMVLGAGDVFAVDTTGQVVTYNTLSYGNNFTFGLSNGKSSKVSCDTNSSASRAGYTVPLNTPWGRAAAATVIAAKITGQVLTVYGAGKCDYWGNTEDAAMVAAQP